MSVLNTKIPQSLNKKGRMVWITHCEQEKCSNETDIKNLVQNIL